MPHSDITAGKQLFDQAYQCLMTKDPFEKAARAMSLRQAWQAGELNLRATESIKTLVAPGRPQKPELVSPRQLPRRNFNSKDGRLSLVHAIAHIEFNAINLALDALYRFQSMPPQYCSDWCQVASEEAQHFLLLSDYLNQHEMHYGDLAAHNGLWEMAVKTDFDVLVRMALVPRVLEARGLDVTPGMIKKLQARSEQGLVSILQRIFEDEIGHVRIGTHWFNTLCEQRDIDSEKTFASLLDTYMQGATFGPFEIQARQRAGFSAREMQDLICRM